MPSSTMKVVGKREARKLIADSHTSAARLFAYLAGEGPYLGDEVPMFNVIGADGQPATYRPFDEGLMRHDLHVVLYTRNALVGYVPEHP